jgi:alkylation response protein AidB-like acyl-CoA dehydrogenase
MCASISQELQMLDSMAKEFAESELVPGREDFDEFPFKPLFDGALKKASEVGFFSLMLPEDVGGANRSMKALCTVLRETCRADASLGGVIFTNALAQEVMINAGASEMIPNPEEAGGDPQKALLAFAPFDNPVETKNRARAKAVDGEYFLDGGMEYVMLGGLADRVLVPAVMEGQKDISFFLVEAGLPEVRVSEPVISLGLHACPAVDIKFREAPATLVGEEGKGGDYLGQAADRLSVACASMSSGIMLGSFVTALDYARERMQGGRLILDWSQMRMSLADIAIKIKCADLIVDAAGTSVDEAEEGWQHASRAAALHICPIACDVANEGIQLLGGNGYMHEYGQEKRFRDAQTVQSLLGMLPMRKLAYLNMVLEAEKY